MKKSVHIKIILLISALSLLFFRAEAKDIYISTTGTSAVVSSTSEAPAPFSALQAYLSAYTVSDDRTLNIYFAAGIYSVTSHLTFPARANVNNLTVTMSPTDPAGAGVIFDGSSAGNSVRFIATREMSSSTTMTVNINGVTIQNFSTTDGTERTTTLIQVDEYSTVNLDGVFIHNISSARNPLVSIDVSGQFHVKNSTISNVTNISTLNRAIFETSDTRCTLSFQNCILNNWQGAGNNGTDANMFLFENTNPVFDLKDCTVSNCYVRSRLVRNSATAGRMTITGNTFTNNRAEGYATYSSLIHVSDGSFYIHGNTFSGNTSADLIRISGSSVDIYNNTFGPGNTVTNVVSATGGSADIYNNTFSGNTVTSQAINMATTYIRVFNNTLYLSGSIDMTGNYSHVVNNIIVGGGIGGTAAYVRDRSKRNITRSTASGEVLYRETGGAGSTGTTITAAFDRQFDPVLRLHSGPGRQVHHLLEDETSEHTILGKGGTLRSLSQELGIAVTTTLMYDQLGSLRPERISIGAVDLQEFLFTSEGTISSIYNSEGEPATPQPVSCDLSQFIDTYPDEVDKTNTTFLIEADPANGTITQAVPGSHDVVFTPTATEGASRFTVTVTGTDEFGFVHKESFTVRTFIYDIASYTKIDTPPPGYVDEEQEACFDFMGTVEFTSAYRFRSHLISENDEGTRNRLYGFSIPLVGDLNGDGYPEIIGALGEDLAANYRGIAIYNGQTGQVIQRLTYPGVSSTSSGGYSSSTYHSTPSSIAIVDSDRDGTVELIVALPGGGGSSAYRRKVISFNIKYNNGTYTLEERWRSRDVYTTLGSSYEKPIPQVVDIDGDGTPEVVVYNKIYNAAAKPDDGLLDPIIVLDENGTPYVGSDSNARDNDPYINFSYSYDMDGDGKYDIIAGGKIYYDIDLHKSGDAPYYKTMQMPGVPDGRTGVADINGDGIPDVVSVSRTSGGNSSTVIITVWNPNFWEIEGGQIVAGSKIPEIIAECNLPLSRTGGGD